MGADAGSNKIRKAELTKTREIKCGLCPYHKKENAPGAHRRRPRSDHKNHRRG